MIPEELLASQLREEGLSDFLILQTYKEYIVIQRNALHRYTLRGFLRKTIYKKPILVKIGRDSVRLKLDGHTKFFQLTNCRSSQRIYDYFHHKTAQLAKWSAHARNGRDMCLYHRPITLLIAKFLYPEEWIPMCSALPSVRFSILGRPEFYWDILNYVQRQKDAESWGMYYALFLKSHQRGIHPLIALSYLNQYTRRLPGAVEYVCHKGVFYKTQIPWDVIHLMNQNGLV